MGAKRAGPLADFLGPREGLLIASCVGGQVREGARILCSFLGLGGASCRNNSLPPSDTTGCLPFCPEHQLTVHFI